MGAHNAKGPHIPSAEIQNNLPAAMVRFITPFNASGTNGRDL